MLFIIHNLRPDPTSGYAADFRRRSNHVSRCVNYCCIRCTHLCECSKDLYCRLR